MALHGRPRKCDPRVNELRSNIRLDEFDIVKATLHKFGVDATDGEGRTALVNATIENKPELISWLIEQGTNINHQDRSGYSALHFAAAENALNLVKILLKAGADPNLQDMHGNIPLWAAMFQSKLEVNETVQLLIRSGSDYSQPNHYENSPEKMFKVFYGKEISSLRSASDQN